ncbi:SbcC/MukB-like Walker B domain-containing protein [Fibrobacter sp. HC4]|uniref:SbcC/MukB-like Walker B domain-containing protein n=1 Tax=Fibrobacter sp. HC4 TaxID=3239812 RepID=UPI00201A183D|nr:SbcC/MukB-like Walker B domain-containing protein [Fibrobacter succinogenes]MCL4100672.1 Chromosome partition protein Smc [Fibrobacter succinogenes]
MEFRKTAKKLLLLNWSCFQNVCIELGSSTLFTGVNGTGKTTILDAMSYLLFANTQFNRAADDKERTVNAYIHGDRKTNGSDRYLRKDAVVSYIVMEFNSPTEGDFVVGVNIESRSAQDSAESKWFIFQNAKIEDFNFRSVENGRLSIASGKNLTRKGIPVKASEMLGREKAKPAIARALGLRISDGDFKKYVEKILKMMAFKPEKNVEKFVKDSVLVQNDVNSLQSLREQKNHYSEALQMLENNKKRKELLEKIEVATTAYEKQLKYMNIRKMMFSYQFLQKDKQDLEKRELLSKTLVLEQGQLESQKKTVETELETARESRTKVKDSNRTLSDSLGSKNEELKNCKEKIKECETSIAALKNLQVTITQLLPQIENDISVSKESQEILKNLAEDGIDASEKQTRFIELGDQIQTVSEEYTANKVRLEDRRDECKKTLAEIERNIKDLQAKKVIFPKDAENAKCSIQEEFNSRSIKSEVRFFAELVEEIKDESWRLAIETFLGRKRYYLIVDDEYCDVALRILKEKKLTNANVVLSDKIPDSDIEKDSAAEILEIKNKAARKYANHLLNGIHLCHTIEELHDYPKGGLMTDGMLAKSYAASLMKTSDIVPCLGKNAIEMQLKIKERDKEQVSASLQRTCDKISSLSQLLRLLNNIEWDPEEYDFEAVEKFQLLKNKLGQIADEIESLKKSPEMLRAMQEIEMAEKRVSELKESSDELSEKLGGNKASQISNNKSIVNLIQSIENRMNDYQGLVKANLELEQEMFETYAQMAKQQNSVLVIAEKTVKNAVSDLNDKEKTLENIQLEYNKLAGKDLNERGVAYIWFYREEYRDIANAKLDEAQNKLDEAQKKLQKAFLYDFIAELKENIEKAREEIDIINKELKKIPFGIDFYQFKMEERPDRKIFFDICNNLESYINQDFFNPMKVSQDKFNADVQKFLDDILQQGSDEMEYSDYRNYFVYDMSIRRKNGEEMDLSQKQGSASGGEKQTPYFIILAASLMQFYPKEKNCARVAFIDEAFSALSKERIEQMVKFLEENHFQVFYAAPPEKIDSIGSHIDNTVALYSDGKYTYAEEGIRKSAV